MNKNIDEYKKWTDWVVELQADVEKLEVELKHANKQLGALEAENRRLQLEVARLKKVNIENFYGMIVKGIESGSLVEANYLRNLMNGATSYAVDKLESVRELVNTPGHKFDEVAWAKKLGIPDKDYQHFGYDIDKFRLMCARKLVPRRKKR